MILKERTKSVSHRILESLYAREALSSGEKVQYKNQIKGYFGETAFDNQLKNATLPGLLINDLLLSTRDTYYQIDSLLITDHHIYLYEIKNYTGAYLYRDGDIYSESGHLVQNPAAQAARKRSYLHNLLMNLGYQSDITAHVVYINPDFYIYSLPKTSDVLFYGQLTRHFDSIANSANVPAKRQRDLAIKLVDLHDNSYRPTNLPEYSYKCLKKGIMCSECFSFNFCHSRQSRTCLSCGHREKTADAIQRSVEELKLLFPTIPVTKNIVVEWCGETQSDSRVRRVLKQHYRLHSASRSSYYD